jgi:hypothetical protein
MINKKELLIKKIEDDRRLTISTTNIMNKEIERIIHKGENKIYDRIVEIINEVL